MAGHGRPDWYNITPLVQIHASEDINELAARLGSPDTFDRRGNVSHIYTFESGLGEVETQAVVSGSACYLTASPSYLGKPVADLYTIGNVNAYTLVSGRGSTEQAQTYGAEFIFSQSAQEYQIIFYLNYTFGSYLYSSGIKLNPATSAAYYYDSSGNWIQITGTFTIYDMPNLFNNLKLAIDIANTQYLRFILNDTHVSLVGIPLRQTAATTKAMINWSVIQLGGSSLFCDLYLAAVILTINEL